MAMSSLISRLGLLRSYRTLSSSTRAFSTRQEDEQHHSPDYYAVLGINRSANSHQVKLAYFKQAKKYHPDTNPSYESRIMFELAAEAYDVLHDEDKRKVFDETGRAGFTFGGTSGGPQRPADHTQYDSEELFGKIFGESEKGDGPIHSFAAPESSKIDSTREFLTTLTFEEAARGVKDYPIMLHVRAICHKCGGTKSELGYTWQVCVYCEGTGVETEKVGHVLTRKTCSYCEGTRQFIKNKCIECEATGQTIQRAQYLCDIPPGVENGQVLKFPLSEDILKFTIAHHPYFYLYITVEDSDYFERDEHDVFSRSDISLSQAVLGGRIRVRGIHEDSLDVDVPAGISSHKTVCCPDQGVTRSDGGYKGSHFVRLGIRVPTELSARQREIMTEFAALEELCDGIVEGVETADDHKYKNGVVEPDSVKRDFKPSGGGGADSDGCDKQTMWSALRQRLPGKSWLL